MNIKDLAKRYEKVKNHIDRHSSLQITDNREIIADGCRRIVSCNEVLVVFEQPQIRVTVMGRELKLRNWGKDGVTVSGIINSLELNELGGVTY
ncbi:MAG: hypothetical protein FWF94_08495 [Oscillospiraceae bacterium]|nr:hypothetical protein [Oscillospiraceae bacterium]